MTHFVTWRRSKETRECGLDWCHNKFYAKGLCQHHYQTQLAGKPLINPNGPKPECEFAGCDREISTGNLCRTHYAQKWLGKPLAPIREYNLAEDDAHPGKRKCKTCQQWKDREEEFYSTSGGGKQGECKQCMIKRNRANKVAKNLREQGVLV